MKYFWTLLLAIAFALMGKWLGRFIAKTHFTDDTSAVLTLAAHRAALKKVGRVAIAIFVVWLLMLCLSSFIAPWITVVGWIPLIMLNCCLAVLAGTAASLASLLYRPSQWDGLQVLIEQRERLIRFLKQFIPKQLIPVAIIVLGAGLWPTLAGDACGVVIDPTPSVNKADSTGAKGFLTSTVFDAIDTLGCRHVVSVAVGCDVRFASRTWLEVPGSLPRVECSVVEPKPLSGHSTLWGFVRGIVDARKTEAINRCEADNEANERAQNAARALFTESFVSSLSTTEHSKCSRITELVTNLAESGLYSAIIIVTDAVDNPASNLGRLVVPPGVRVIIILARPNPGYARVEDGLARAAQWARIPGVTVVTAAELRPDFWRTTFLRSSR